jgi:hypothetical protein
VTRLPMCHSLDSRAHSDNPTLPSPLPFPFSVSPPFLMDFFLVIDFNQCYPLTKRLALISNMNVNMYTLDLRYLYEFHCWSIFSF